MSHISSVTSVASTMIRPRLLYLSTSDVQDYADASSVEIPLRDQIFAQDGFKLVYGVRSFGYNSSVMNISARQKNNQISIKVKYQAAAYIYDPEDQLWLENTTNTVTTEHIVTLPDGNYDTLDELFSSLNEWILKIVDSGFRYDRTKSDFSRNNVIGLPLTFSNHGNYFTIDYGSPAGIVSRANYPNTIDEYLWASEVNNLPIEISLLPAPDNYGLWEILFKNVSSSNSNKPVCLPSFSIESGVNPPNEIKFVIDVASYSTWGFLGTDGENFDGLQVDMIENLEYGVIEFPNESLLNTTNTDNIIYPVKDALVKRNIPYTAYHSPVISPIYVDILSNLDNYNMTTSGLSKNLLVRQFVLGGVNGANSFFQSWDTPIYNILDSQRSISSVKIDFKSEQDKWNFFNLEFSLELIIFEVEDVQINKEFEEPIFTLPTDDGYTSMLKQYSPSIQNPFPILGSGQKIAVTEYNDILNRRVKRRL